MKRHKGDPQALIDSIDRKELKGFSARFRQQLYEYLVKNDYLTESTPFSNEEIKSRMLISVDRYGLDQAMMERFFDRIFERDPEV
jgi:chorismate mutase